MSSQITFKVSIILFWELVLKLLFIALRDRVLLMQASTRPQPDVEILFVATRMHAARAVNFVKRFTLSVSHVHYVSNTKYNGDAVDNNCTARCLITTPETDLAPPSLVWLTISPSVVDARARRAFVELRFSVRDDESGLHFGQVAALQSLCAWITF